MGRRLQATSLSFSDGNVVCDGGFEDGSGPNGDGLECRCTFSTPQWLDMADMIEPVRDKGNGTDLQLEKLGVDVRVDVPELTTLGLLGVALVRLGFGVPRRRRTA